MDKPNGTLSPESFVGITVKFKPKEASHYYRRVYCLIEHQEPLVIELVATCFDDKRRPPSFDVQQIKRYRHRLDVGLYPYPPEQLDEVGFNKIMVTE